MMDNMKETKFSIGDVQFSIKKLNALAGFRMLESIRYEMSKTEITKGVTDEKDVMQKLITSIMSFDPDFIEGLRVTLFVNIEYKTPDVERGWLPLTDTLDMAFADLEPSAIYEVLARSLVVNFTRSFEEILSRLKSSGLTSKA